MLALPGPDLANLARTSRRVLALCGLSIVAVLGAASPAGAQDQTQPGKQSSASQSDASAAEPVHTVLSNEDADRYSEIFQEQEDGHYGRADEILKQVGDKVLVGHALAARYLDTGYSPRYSDLHAWLDQYGDLPQAEDIYKLALKKHRRKDPAPRHPNIVKLHGVGDYEPDLAPPQLNAYDRRRVSYVQRTLKRNLSAGHPAAAQKFLETAKVQRALSPFQVDQVRLWIASSYFFNHADEAAYSLAHDVAERRREKLPLADWVAGLAAWNLGKTETAVRHFELVTNSDELGPWMRASAAYWAARANLVAHVPEAVTKDLRLAAKYPFTFYGLLALRQLGEAPKFVWDKQPITPEDYARALDVPSVKRGIALAQIGEISLADQEIRRAHAVAPGKMDRALIALAAEYQLAAAQLHIAERSNMSGVDAALYPIPAYRPQNGFTVDRALLYAFMRQESAFKPAAKSHAGASGLMQIMPATAALVAGDRSLKKRNKSRLHDPGYNLKLAQDYIAQLLPVTEPKGNLFMLAVAYNAGPGNLRKWYGRMETQDDPLLFIESVPSRETRAYIERVLANLWIYRDRLKQPSPSLDMVASGTWPVYDPQETTTAGTQPVGVGSTGGTRANK